MTEREVTISKGDLLLIRFEYDRRLVELVKGLPDRKWNQVDKYWTVPAQHVIAVVELLQDEGFSFDEATQRLYDQKRGAAKDNLTVSQLNLQVRSALHSAFSAPLWLVGELSGYGKSAHRDVVTFQLVEREEGGGVMARVGAVLFSDVRQALEKKLQQEGDPFRLEDEITVRALVQVDLYVPWGSYRVVIRDLDVAYTLGEVARRREEIVRKLTKEGLIERNRSLPFPLVPLRVGLITGIGSDAEKDVLKTLRESGYAFQVTVHGVRVQGPYTESSTLNALDWFRVHADEFDVILICRGGGSRADLAWFDSEELGRAVATFPLPVVVGIGHEEDRSVLDEVGRRAKTPTAAADFFVQRVRKTEQHLEEVVGKVLSRGTSLLSRAAHEHKDRAARTVRAIERCLSGARGDLDRLARALPRAVRTALREQRRYLSQVRGRLAGASRRELTRAAEKLEKAALLLPPRGLALISRERERLGAREGRLHALDPKRVVERGYAILRLSEGNVITDPAQAPSGTRVVAKIRGGLLWLLSEGGESISGEE